MIEPKLVCVLGYALYRIGGCKIELCCQQRDSLRLLARNHVATVLATKSTLQNFGVRTRFRAWSSQR